MRRSILNVVNKYREFIASGGVTEEHKHEDCWGISFDINGEHIFLFSRPEGGIFCESSSSRSYQMNQLMGTCQFDGTTPAEVEDWVKKIV